MSQTEVHHPELSNCLSNGSFWSESPLEAWWRWRYLTELVAVFISGVAVATFLYQNDAGVPGNDSFYHVKMAVLLPELGVLERFEWLTTTIFADRFVSHHWGFHVLMVPFVYAGQWLSGDYLVGAKWGITFFFSVMMVLFQLLLMTQRVRCRWLWLALYLVMPAQFFGRHLFIRAIAPSLACMLLLLLLMFRRHYIWVAVLVAAYVNIYLGAVCYVPLLVGAYFGVGLLGAAGDRVSWKLPAWTVAGLAVGLLTHPYGAVELLSFLKVQLFGSGLTPDIPVGREWKSYEGRLWDVVLRYFGAPLSLLVLSITVRLRTGPRLTAEQAAVLVVNFAFLVMAFRQRRFIESWPPFGLLASALLWQPVVDRWATRTRDEWHAWSLLPAGLGCAGAFCLLATRGRRLGIGEFVAEWPVWVFVAGAVCLTPLSSVWSRIGRMSPGRAGAGNVLCGVVIAGLIMTPLVIGFSLNRLPRAQINVPWWAWMALGLSYLIAPWIGGGSSSEKSDVRRADVCVRAVGTVLVAATVAITLMIAGAGQLVDVRRGARCKFDLPAVRAAMDYLKANSPADSIVFTDDWDVFPLYFYHNHHNRYIVGLDPKFSHERDPVLWERYVRITQSKRFPTESTVEVLDEHGQPTTERIDVRLEDIRDYFGASFVITDPDHARLAHNLDRASEFVERVYPPKEGSEKHRPPFTIYRIKAVSQTESAD